MSRGIEEVLADCLDQIDRGETTAKEALWAHPELRSELEPLLRLAHELLRAPRLRAPESLRTTKRPVFTSPGTPTPVRLEDWRQARTADRRAPGWAALLARMAAGLAVALLLLGGSAAVSAGSLPEEPLYPVKLALENARLALAPSPETRTELQLQFASRRLEEVESAASQGRTAAVERGLELYQERVENALKDQPAEPAAGTEETRRLLTSLDQQQEVLNRVYAQAPPQAQPALLRAIEATGRDRPKFDNKGADSTAEPAEGSERKDQAAKDKDRESKAEEQGNQARGSAGGPEAGDRRPATATSGPRATATTIPVETKAATPRSTDMPERDRGKAEKAGEPAVEPTVVPTAQATRIPDQPGRDRGWEGSPERGPEAAATSAPEATPTTVRPDRGRSDGPPAKAEPAATAPAADPGRSDNEKEDLEKKSSSQPSTSSAQGNPLDAAVTFLKHLLGRTRR